MKKEAIENKIEPIIIERKFMATASNVWSAISDRDEMKNWFIDLEHFKPEPGFEFRFTSGPDPDRQYLHICEVIEAVPEKKLSYSWRYDGYAGDSLVSFEIFEIDSGAVLKLTHQGIGSFPDNPDFAAANFAAGWDQIINKSLSAYLEKS